MIIYDCHQIFIIVIIVNFSLPLIYCLVLYYYHVCYWIIYSINICNSFKILNVHRSVPSSLHEISILSACRSRNCRWVHVPSLFNTKPTLEACFTCPLPPSPNKWLKGWGWGILLSIFHHFSPNLFQAMESWDFFLLLGIPNSVGFTTFVAGVAGSLPPGVVSFRWLHRSILHKKTTTWRCIFYENMALFHCHVSFLGV